MAACLDRGTNNRTTASTLMNNNEDTHFNIPEDSNPQDPLLISDNDDPMTSNINSSKQQTPPTAPYEEILRFLLAIFHYKDLINVPTIGNLQEIEII